MSVLLGTALWLAVLATAASAAGTAIVIPVDDAIGPATADFVQRGLARAAEEGAEVAVLQLDTPGGLDTSMRVIIKDVLASPVPVVVWVGPSGARAASAGTYILYAAHVAAMAPATNLGAATPVMMGGPGEGGDDDAGGGKPAPEAPAPTASPAAGASPSGPSPSGAQPTPSSTGEPAGALGGSALTRKQVNDSAAYIRGLAQARGRNADWAERAVREAVSLSAEEALAQDVIEILAADLDDLLRQLDGRKVTLPTGERELDTEGIVIERVEPDWRTRVLAVITNPSIAYILLLVGIYGILFEFYSPGFVLPGVVGAICLVVALFALHLLPFTYAGLALIVLGVAFMVAEAFLPSFGALGIGGGVALVMGSVLLIETDVPGFGLPASLIATVTAVTALAVFGLVGMALRTRNRPVVSGREAMVGAVAEVLEVLEDSPDEGWARVEGEIWRVRSDAPLRRGERVRVTGMNGLVLNVSVEGRDPKKGTP